MKPHLPAPLRRALMAALITIAPTLGSSSLSALGWLSLGTLLSAPAASAAETNARNIDTTEAVTLNADTDYRFNHDAQGHSHLYNGGLNIGTHNLALYTTFNHAAHVMVNGLSGDAGSNIYLYRGVDANNQGYTDSFMLLYLKGQGSYSGTIHVGSKADGSTPDATAPTLLMLDSGSIGQSAGIELKSGNKTDNILALTGDVTIGSLTAQQGKISSIDPAAFTNEALKVVSSDNPKTNPTLTLASLTAAATPYKLTLTGNSSISNTVIDATLVVSSGVTLTLGGTITLNKPIENSGTITLADNFDFTKLTHDPASANSYTSPPPAPPAASPASKKAYCVKKKTHRKVWMRQK